MSGAASSILEYQSVSDCGAQRCEEVALMRVNDSLDAVMTIRRELGVCALAAYGIAPALGIDENRAHLLEGLGVMLDRIAEELANVEVDLSIAANSLR